MNLKFGATLAIILHISATSNCYGFRRAGSHSTHPHHYTSYDEEQVDEAFKKPEHGIRPVGQKIGIPPTQEYPVSPRKYPSRVTVSKIQDTGIDIPKNLSSPFAGKIEEALENKDTLMQMPVQKVTDQKELVLNRGQSISDTKDDTMMDNKNLISLDELESIAPLQKTEESKEDTLQRVQIPSEEIKEAAMEMDLLPVTAAKDAVSIPLQKANEAEETVMDNDVEFKDAITRIVVDTLGKLQDMQILDKTELPLEIGNDMITRAIGKIENGKEMVTDKVGLPADKSNDLRDILSKNPLEKLVGANDIADKALLPVGIASAAKDTANGAASMIEDMKDTIIGSPAEKMEDMRDTIVGMPTGNMEEMKDSIVGMSTGDIEEMKDRLIRVPTENMKVAKDAAVGMPMEKLEEMADQVINVGPVDKSEGTKKTIDLIEMPREKLRIGFSPIAKIAEIKTAVKTDEILMDQTANMKGIAADKVGSANALKEIVLASTISKPENVTDLKDDLKDIILTAFTRSIMGDRKEYFKQAIGKMNKEELADLHDALLSVFNMKELSAPLAPGLGHVAELKNAVHELVTSSTTDNKESFAEIEKVLEIVEDPKQALQINSAANETGSSPSTNNNATKSMLSSPSKLANATMEKSDAEVDEIFDPMRKFHGMENIRSKRRWGMGTHKHFDRGMFHQRDQNLGRSWGRGKRSIYGVGTTAQELRNFFPPAGLRLPMKTAFRQINSAAPPDPYPKSKESLNLPILSINEVATDKIMMDIKEGLKYVLQTRNDFTFAIHGSATTGCHAVLDNLVEGGDKVLAFTNGYWGELMANMSERLGAQVVRFKTNPGKVFTLDEIQTAIRVHRPDIVAVVQGESSTTVRQPLEGVGDLCEKHGALLVVDVVAVAGMQPVLMDKYKMDAVFTSSNKGLGGVCGLAPISLSPRAVQKMKTRLTPPRAYQTDLTLQAELWNTDNPDRTRFQSMSLPLMYALREALATMVEERIENTFKRHELTSEHLNRGLTSLGLENFVENPEDRLIGITAVKVPTGKDAKKIADYMFKNYNIEISSGFGPTAGKVLRIAIFANNADTYRTSNILRALKNALNSRETSISY